MTYLTSTFCQLQGEGLADSGLARTRQLQVSVDNANVNALAAAYSQTAGVRAIQQSQILVKNQEALMAELDKQPAVTRQQCQLALEGDKIQCKLSALSGPVSGPTPASEGHAADGHDDLGGAMCTILRCVKRSIRRHSSFWALFLLGCCWALYQ